MNEERIINLPSKIDLLIGNDIYMIDDIGKSNSKVLLFADKSLK